MRADTRTHRNDRKNVVIAWLAALSGPASVPHWDSNCASRGK
jgi:hypothetical protein